MHLFAYTMGTLLSKQGKTMSKSEQLAIMLVNEPYAWPGGYPKFAITDDGAALCDICCGAESSLIAESFPGDGWHVVALDINWEDPELYCDHCSHHIEPAYGDDNE